VSLGNKAEVTSAEDVDNRQGLCADAGPSGQWQLAKKRSFSEWIAYLKIFTGIIVFLGLAELVGIYVSSLALLRINILRYILNTWPVVFSCMVTSASGSVWLMDLSYRFDSIRPHLPWRDIPELDWLATTKLPATNDANLIFYTTPRSKNVDLYKEYYDKVDINSTCGSCLRLSNCLWKSLEGLKVYVLQHQMYASLVFTGVYIRKIVN